MAYDHCFLVYDEDSFDEMETTILYMYPPQMPEERLMALASTVKSMESFALNFSKHPIDVLVLSKMKLVMKTVGDITLVLSGSRDDADDIVMNNLVELIEAIEFYVGPVHRLVMDAQAGFKARGQQLVRRDIASSVNERLHSHMASILQYYMRAPKLDRSFQPNPHFELPPQHNRSFIQASNIVLSIEDDLSNLACCVFFMDQVLCSHLHPEITRWIIMKTLFWRKPNGRELKIEDDQFRVHVSQRHLKVLRSRTRKNALYSPALDRPAHSGSVPRLDGTLSKSEYRIEVTSEEDVPRAMRAKSESKFPENSSSSKSPSRPVSPSVSPSVSSSPSEKEQKEEEEENLKERKESSSEIKITREGKEGKETKEKGGKRSVGLLLLYYGEVCVAVLMELEALEDQRHFIKIRWQLEPRMAELRSGLLECTSRSSNKKDMKKKKGLQERQLSSSPNVLPVKPPPAYVQYQNVPRSLTISETADPSSSTSFAQTVSGAHSHFLHPSSITQVLLQDETGVTFCRKTHSGELFFQLAGSNHHDDLCMAEDEAHAQMKASFL